MNKGRDKVLLVDDSVDIRETLSAYLENQGFEVISVPDGRQMRLTLAASQIDLILLDVMLPDEDGLSLCRFVMETQRIPIIFLTGRTAAADRVSGLELGADDYVVKPFDPRELVARMHNLLRRVRQGREGVLPRRQYLQFDHWLLDMARKLLLTREGGMVALSPIEFRLLCAFVEHPGEVFDRERLLDLVDNSDDSAYDRSIDSHISRLRRKLGERGQTPRLLKTVRGNGYQFTADVRAVML